MSEDETKADVIQAADSANGEAASEFDRSFAEFSEKPGQSVDDEKDEAASAAEAAEAAPSPLDENKTGDSSNDPPKKQGKKASEDAEKSGSGTEDDLSRRLDASEKRAQELERRLKSESGRQSALMKKSNELQAQLDALLKKNGKSGQGNSRLDQLKEDFPDVASVLQEELQGIRNEMHNSIRPLEDIRQKHDRSHAEDEVRKVHPDFVEMVNTREFSDWYLLQPPAVRALSESDDPLDAIALLNYFNAARVTSNAKSDEKAGSGEIESIKLRRDAALKRNASIQAPRTASVSEGIPDDFNNAFAYFSKQRDKRRSA